MKTTTLIAFLTVVSAVSIGAISMSTTPSIALATGSISPEAGTIMGHVEYVVRDNSGNIKHYQQLDNMVVNKGDDCVIGYAFQTAGAGGSDNCTISADGFRFIGIGNGTITVDAADTTLLDGGVTTVASNGVGGIMAVKADSDTVGSPSSDGGTVVIATETPFLFFNSGAGISNTTTVLSAGLFDATCQTVDATNGHCTANGSTMNMFSAQSISVLVGDGDSLDVTWTITVGNAS